MKMRDGQAKEGAHDQYSKIALCIVCQIAGDRTGFPNTVWRGPRKGNYFFIFNFLVLLYTSNLRDFPAYFSIIFLS